MKSEHFYIHQSYGLRILVEQHDDYYVAEVAELPGCVGEGDTLNEVLAEVASALEVVLEVIQEDEPERFAQLVRPVVTSSRVTGQSISTGPAQLHLVAA